MAVMEARRRSCVAIRPALLAVLVCCGAPLLAVQGPSSPGWYGQPVASWTAALPIGNGSLGAMVWGGTRIERLDLNEATLWSGEPYENLNPQGLAALPEVRRLLLAGDDSGAQRLIERRMNGRNTQCYLPLGDLKLAFPLPGEVTDYHRELDLETGVVRVARRENVVDQASEGAIQTTYGFLIVGTSGDSAQGPCAGHLSDID